ncbi:MAG: hypothetical protein RL749_1786, partial [Verrucomicrobiota bacterium]
MKLSFKKLLLGALLCLLHIVAMAADVFQPGVVLVTYKKDATPEQVAAVEAKYSLTLKRRLAAFRISFYDCTAQPLPPDQLSKVLSTESSVSAASPDFGAKVEAADTRFGEQWYLQNTGQTVGDVVGASGIDINYVRAKSIYAPKQSILVGVVDSGITLLHPDLVGSLHAKPAEVLNGIDDDGNGLIDDVTGFNWFDPHNITVPIDSFGHGTQVAGIIAATADNGQGIHGIAPSAKIVSHRVFSSLGRMGSPKYANISDVIFAVAASVEEGAKIVNLSLGGSSYSAVYEGFYADLADEDVLIVASAGNGGSDGIGDNNDVTAHYPSSYGSAAIISVAAIDQKGALAEFSNYGLTSVDIAAPGTNILTTDVTRKTVHAPVFSVSNGGWKPYRLTATDFSYAQWGFSNGWMRDRIDGSQFYKAGTDTFLLSPRISLAGEYGAVVSFAGASNLADDYAWLESSSDGFNWETAYVFPKSGASSSLKADLADYDFGDLYLRFRIKSNSYNQSNGVLIKDLKVTSVDVLDEQNPSYTITAGTSFSAPIVSGVAAMVWMHRPELTAAQVKSIILDSARKLPALNGKVATGGIVDAEAALKLADVRTGNVLPVVIDQPDGGTYLQGASMTLSVFATSGLPATYQWRKDGVNISGATLSTYSINSLQVGDSGRYDVVVTSRAGAVVSASAQITVAARPPAIDSQPTRPALVMIAGENGYTMSVSATGTAPFAYQWLKAGVAIPGATSSSFTLNNLKTTDAGVYTVRVSNAAGSVTSQPVTVSVSVRPAFKTDLPATATVLTGATRTLAVAATGSPLPTYQWRKDGVDIPNARLASYVVPATSVPTTATYSVVITNAAGSVESTLCQLSSVTIVSVPASGQPQARNLKVGDSASFTVTPAGTGPFTYQWLKSGVVIAGATSQTYTIPAVSALDAAAYSVRVSNGAGTATSLAATLSVLGFKTDLPATATVLTGATRTLAVAATGSPLPTYQWRKDGVDILNARLASYVVPATSVPTTATYSVVITNAAGSLESTLCQLSSVSLVSVPPSGQPQARNVVAGQSASFTVTPAGTGPFSYQWLRNGVVIAGATSQTYSIAFVSALDAATYSVRVSNGGGTATSLGAILKVITPFNITGQPNAAVGTMVLAAGTSKALTVTVAGAGPFTYQWRKDGQPIAGATLASYLVQAGSVVGSAVYDVVITGPVSATSSSAVRVDTVLPPSFLQHPASVARALGQPATFSVSMAGTGPFAYQWLKNGIVIPGATGVAYTVESVVATSPGNYSVKVTGPGGSATSLTGTLSLQTAPAVSAQPSNQYKAVGQSVTFSVAATGTGPLSYQWSKDGAPILGANSASYAIAAVSAEHVGRYSVSVSNAVGSVLSQEAELVIVTTPAIVTQPTASNPVSAAGTRLYRARYFGFNHGPDGWSVVPWSGKDFEWPTSGWYWNDQIDEGLDESNLEGAAGGGATVSPLISLVGLTSPELRFRIGTLGAVSIHVSTDKVNWTPLFSIPAGSSFSNDPIAVSLSAFAGRSCYLRFTSTSGTWLDEVEIWGTGLAKEIVELAAYAEGEGLSYQWFKDGVAIAGATARGYVIPDATLVTSVGNYTVRISNAAGSVTSSAAKVGVAPTITVQPVAQSKAAGQAAAFSVVAVGTGPLTYQWYKDSVALPGATSAAYSILSAGSQHAGNYSVVITGPMGQATSQTVALSVALPPAILTQPTSYVVPVETMGIYPDTTYNFETGMQGWVSSAGPANMAAASWQYTVSNNLGGTLRGLYCDNNSSNSAERYITSPRISLSEVSAPYVTYKSGYTSYTMARQGTLTLEASADGVNWEFLSMTPNAGSPFTMGGPGTGTASLAQFANTGVYLRFKASGPQTGFWLDDVVVR